MKTIERYVGLRNGVELDPGITSLIEELDRHTIESSLPNKGLVLAYNFPPFSDASAATVAKRIRQLGRPVDVVSQDLSEIRREDPDLTQLVDEFVESHYRLLGETGFASWRPIRNYVVDGYAVVKQSLDTQEYGFLYSRSMFPATHFLAAFIKIRHPELFWISEFSDPVRHDVEGNARPSQKIALDYVSRSLQSGFSDTIRDLLTADQTVFAWCEALGVLASDKVVFTNKHQKQVMLQPYSQGSLHESTERKSIISPHPTLGKEFYGSAKEAKPSGVIDIGYFGEFYPNRGVGELVQAIAGMHSDHRDKFKVHVHTSNTESALSSLKGFKYDTSFVKIKASKDLFTFLELASAMDVLYVSDVSSGLGYANNPYLPSKFSDYRGAGVPIIASIWPGSILSENKEIHKFILGDIQGMRAFLTGLAA